MTVCNKMIRRILLSRTNIGLIEVRIHVVVDIPNSVSLCIIGIFLEWDRIAGESTGICMVHDPNLGLSSILVHDSLSNLLGLGAISHLLINVLAVLLNYTRTVLGECPVKSRICSGHGHDTLTHDCVGCKYARNGCDPDKNRGTV